MRTLLAAALLALLGCSGKKPVSGNEWADRTLGADAARTLLARYVFASVPVEDSAMVLPRPFVILHKPDERDGRYYEGPPEFHPLNASLPPDLAPRSAADLRALVHVERSSRTLRLADLKIKRRTVKNYTTEEFLCVAVSVRRPDGTFQTVGSEAIDSVDPQDLLEYLRSLPAAPGGSP